MRTGVTVATLTNEKGEGLKCIGWGPKASEWQNQDFEPSLANPVQFLPRHNKPHKHQFSWLPGYMMTESVSQVLAPELGSLICYLVSADHGEPVEGRVRGEPSRAGIRARRLIALLFHPLLILILFCFKDMRVHSLFPKGFLV